MFAPGGPTLLELLHQALVSTERGYDLIAPKFDRTPFRTPDALLEAMARNVGPAASIDAALDVCCGTGAAAAWLRALCRERVVGLDFSQGMLDEARRRLAFAPGIARIDLVRGDALAMPFDAEFDLIACTGAFGHILEKDEPRFVRGIHRALRPGGRFVFPTSELPAKTSRTVWMLRGFNAAMRVRNALLRPPFIMYYLTFLWPGVGELLKREGFDVRVSRDVFPAPYQHGLLVTATRARR